MKTATASATKPARPVTNERVFRSIKLELRAVSADANEKLPPGICGRFSDIALVYGVTDDYGTVFEQGCIAKTRAERVNTGKVKVFADHGPYTDCHVGVVRSMDDVGDAVTVIADLFDSEAGRTMKEYLEAVIASGAETGLSIGFRTRDSEWKKDEKTGEMFLHYNEIELREVSITPVPAVPGTDVIGVRREQGETDEDLLKRALGHILRSLPERDARTVFDEVYASAAKPDTPATPTQPPAGAPAGTDAEHAESATGADGTTVSPVATIEERLAAVRGTVKV